MDDQITSCCVLGATGFIGGHIARAAQARGWRVRAIRRRPKATGAIANLEVDWVSADINDPPSLVAAMEGCQLLFHAAGYYPSKRGSVGQAVDDGVNGMRNVLNAAERAGIRRTVYTSSFTTIGPSSDPSRLADERDLYMPGSAHTRYFEAKWAMENEAMRAAAQGQDVTTILPTAVFGPGDVKPATGTLILMIAKRQLPIYVEGITNVVDVRDVAVAHIAAAERGQPGRRYIAGGYNLSVREMIAAAAAAAGVKPPRIKLPLRLLSAAGRIGELIGIPGTDHLTAAQHWQAVDSDSARRQLGLPSPIPIDQTMSDAIEWFRTHGYL